MKKDQTKRNEPPLLPDLPPFLRWVLRLSILFLIFLLVRGTWNASAQAVAIIQATPTPTQPPHLRYDPIDTTLITTRMMPLARVHDSIWLNNDEVLSIGPTANESENQTGKYQFAIYNFRTDRWRILNYTPVDCQLIIEEFPAKEFEFRPIKIYLNQDQQLLLQGKCESIEEELTERISFNIFFQITILDFKVNLNHLTDLTLPNGPIGLDYLMSPDQTQLFYAKPKDLLAKPSSAPSVYSFISIKDGKRNDTTIPKTRAIPEDLSAYNAAWSPSGNQILTTGSTWRNEQYTFRTYILDLDTWKAEIVRSTSGTNLQWINDETAIFFTAKISNIEGAWVFDLDTKSTRYLYDFRRNSCGRGSSYGLKAEISPSGEHLFVHKRSKTAERKCELEIIKIGEY